MKLLLKNNFNYAKKFTNTVRYIDDLLTLKEIYRQYISCGAYFKENNGELYCGIVLRYLYSYDEQ